MADKEYIRPPQRKDFGEFGVPAFKYMNQIAEYVNNSSTKLTGTGTAWDDLRVALTTARLPASNYPDFLKVKDNGSGSTGVFAYHFGDGEYVFLTTQLPHSYKEGSTIYPHIHFMTVTDVSPSDNFGLGMEYLWSDIGDDLAAVTTISTVTVPTGVNSAYNHQIVNIPASGIVGTGMGISSIFMCRLYRYAASTDNYAGDVIITDFDIHFEKDTWGSSGVTTK